MKNEFVTYEQSLALKELKYYDDTLKVYSIKWKKLMEEEYAVRYDVDYAKAPLKQQVFRWFREKYELGHTICPYYFNANITELQDVDDYPSQHEVYVSSPFTYEEAENACIDKLIEIAKQQYK